VNPEKSPLNNPNGERKKLRARTWGKSTNMGNERKGNERKKKQVP
jgi:hypothetical protein